MSDTLHGWHADPFGVHELRYFALNGKPTRLVRDADSWSHHIPTRSSPAVPSMSPWVPARTYFAPGAAVLERLDRPDPFEYAPEVGFLAEGPWLPDVDAELASSSRRAMMSRFIRYGSVSLISIAIGLLVLGILLGGFSVPAVWANVIASAIGAVPSFELNRRWIWARDGQRSARRRAIPYALYASAGLVVSTFAAHLASNATTHSTRPAHTAAIELAVLGSYGALWLVQFAVRERILFRSSAASLDMHDWVEADNGRFLLRPAFKSAHA
jgi:putative flippase GtrA